MLRGLVKIREKVEKLREGLDNLPDARNNDKARMNEDSKWARRGNIYNVVGCVTSLNVSRDLDADGALDFPESIT